MRTDLAMLTFLAPWWAAGAVAAVGLPLLAHLLSRSRYREVVFPATRFVLMATQQTTRVERPRHLLLMLLRGLLLMTVVAAFMRPRWMPQAEATVSERGELLIVLLDASASMRRADAGATLYDRAVRETDRLIAGLDRSTDAAAVIRVTQTPQALLPEPTANLGLVRDALRRSGASYEAVDWPSAFAIAERLAHSSDRAIRLVTVSDQQGDTPQIASPESPLAGVVTRHLRIEGPTDNTAARLVDLTPYPPIAGQPVTATVELSNTGGAKTDAMLSLGVGSLIRERRILLEPGATRNIEMSLEATARGKMLIRVELQSPDAIDADNRTARVVETQERSRVLILHETSAEQRTIAERLGRVLDPGEVAGMSVPEVQIERVANATPLLQAADPAGLRTVVVVGARGNDEAFSNSIRSYLLRGGGVVWFRDRPDPKPAVAAAIDFSLEPLRVFEGPARAGLAELTWPSARSMDPSAWNIGELPLLTSADGRAIVTATDMGRVGSGRLIEIHSGLNVEPGGLFAEPAFVVLFNELCRYASPGPPIPAPARPGDAMPAWLSQSDQLSRPEDADPDSQRFTAPGGYLLLGARGELLDGVWVELDPTESDTRVGPDWQDLGGAQGGDARGPASASSFASHRTTHELWPYLALGALLIAAGESLLLWRFAVPEGGSA